MERTISEGLNYSIREKEIILKEYPKHESKKAHSKGINLAFAYPEFGFRNVILENGNILLIGNTQDKKSKLWNKGVKETS